MSNLEVRRERRTGVGLGGETGEFYAHLFTAEPRIQWALWVYSASRHEWRLLTPSVSRFPISNPTWLGDRGEVAVFALTKPRTASSMIVASVDGGVTRQAQIEGFPGDIDGAKISASPDGRMIAVVAWRQITEETSMWILDANTLALLGSMQLEGGGAMTAPQWNASSSRIALTTRGDLFIIAIGDDGRPQNAMKVDGLPPPEGAVWVPGEQSLLVFASEHAPDVVEFAQLFTKPVDSLKERQIYSIWRYDVATQQLEEYTDLRVVVRGSWYSELVPRVGEAFATWEQ